MFVILRGVQGSRATAGSSGGRCSGGTEEAEHVVALPGYTRQGVGSSAGLHVIVLDAADSWWTFLFL